MDSGSLNIGPNIAPFEIRPLSTAHANEVLELEQDSERILGSKVYSAFSRDRALAVLGQGLSLGVFVEGELIAIRLIEAPMRYDQQIHRYFDIPRYERNSIVNFCGVVVASDYRRHGLATRLTQAALVTLQNDSWKHGFATIAPSNFPSLQYFLALGFEARDLQERGEQGPRLLFHRLLGQTIKREWSHSTSCPAESREQISELFAIGFRIVHARLVGGQVVLEFAHEADTL